VTARRRRRVLDRQRQQLLARRADLDTRVHLGTGSHPYPCRTADYRFRERGWAVGGMSYGAVRRSKCTLVLPCCRRVALSLRT
jgi:hypothetical protein